MLQFFLVFMRSTTNHKILFSFTSRGWPVHERNDVGLPDRFFGFKIRLNEKTIMGLQIKKKLVNENKGSAD